MTRLINLAHTVEAGMTTYPGLPGPVITDHLSREASRSRYDSGTEFQIGRIEMVANTGTYLDTPFHRFADGFDLADLRLEQVADLPGVCIRADDMQIDVDALEGHDLQGMAVLFATGWDQHWGTDHYGDHAHPYITEAAAVTMRDQGVALVGIDSVNIDSTEGGTRPVHTTLLAARIPVVEHLTGLGQLVGMSFRFHAVPAPIRGMGTFPVRAYALLD
jgi:kynurenine formamidase